MKKALCLLILIVALSYEVSSQANLEWFAAESIDENDYTISPDLDCTLVHESSNESGIATHKFMPRQFFVYNHPQVRKYMKDEYLMECTGFINKVEENHFLILEYKINSDKAKVNYGNLEKGGKIKVKLINKDHLYLENIERSRGKVKRNDKYTIYTGTYAINKTNVGLLKKHYIDKITVLWEEGVEEYEVQNIDLVKNQLIYLSNLK